MHNLRSTVAALLILSAALLVPPPSAEADSTVVAVTTLAGGAGSAGSIDGVGAAARFSDPSGVALSADGALALVADTQNHTIRKVDLATGTTSTLAGSPRNAGSANGAGSAARFFHPEGLALSADGTLALVADTDNHTIRKLVLATGQVTTLAGSAGSSGSANGTGATARFSSPAAVALAGAFALVADTGNHTIRRVDLATGEVTTLAGSAGSSGAVDGMGSIARFSAPRGIALDAAGGTALVADTNNHAIRRIVVATGQVTTLAGAAGLPGSSDGAGALARFRYPRGVALSADGSAALVADFSNSTIRSIAVSSGAVTTYAGSAGANGSVDGADSAARFGYPAGVALSGNGSVTLVADTDNQTIRRLSLVDLTPRVILPLAGR
jgi:DNA-binding beta-propeller fold protein YncE